MLRATVGDDVALETELIREGNTVRLPDGKRGRVDLLLQRTLVGVDDEQGRLVVELKRPSVKLGPAELTQVKNYAYALSEHPGAGPSGWTFWLIGADTRDEIGGELKQQDREWGHVIRADRYDVRVMTWGRLLDQAERRFTFYREQLAYKASQEEAVERVRRRHDELLPPEPVPLDQGRRHLTAPEELWPRTGGRSGRRHARSGPAAGPQCKRGDRCPGTWWRSRRAAA